MTRGRQLKSKLRQYSSTTHTNDTTNSEPSTTSATTSSVTEKIAKLRIEQSRAEANRQRRHTGTCSFEENRHHPPSTTAVNPDAPWLNPWTGLLASTNEAASSNSPTTTTTTTRRAAGPPPPPSWTRIRPSQQQKIASSNRLESLQKHRSLLLKQQHQQSGMVSSLVTICCCQLAVYYTTANITPGVDSSWWIYHMKRLPSHIKQRLLYEWSFLGSNGGATTAITASMVTDTTMDVFQKTEYEELWLEASHLSLERLIQGFWKVDQVVTATTTTIPTTATTADEPVDDWEDLLEDDQTTIGQGNNDDDDNYFDNTLPTFILHMDQQEEIGKWGHIYQVMKFLRPDIDNNNNNNNRGGTPDLLPSPSLAFALSSPFLGRTLVSLNLSFMTFPSKADSPFSWVTLAYLMVSTLPHLMWLYTAGCFDNGSGDVVQGTRVLSILSHGLRKLKFWDLCYYDWLQLDLLTSVVDWRRDLLELKTLCLSSSGTLETATSNNQKAVEMSRWFKDHQLSRINIIWIDL